MSLNKEYLNKFLLATEKAAISASLFVGKNDKIAADDAAVKAMRNEFNKIEMNAKIVIGEGEMDEAPMLFIGEELGTKKGQSIDIAVDPLEGTNFVAKGLPGAFSVLAASEKGNLFTAPDTYMEKIAIGADLPKNLLDLDNSVKKNIELLAKAKNRKTNELTACLLKRPRHDNIAAELIKLGVKIKYITDGDVSGVISVINKKQKVDIYMGIGGGPEGVLSAAALSCMGGQIQTRLVLDDDQKIRAKKLGITDFKKKYNIDDMVRGDVIFCATAITDGDLVPGVKYKDNKYSVSSLIMHKHDGIIKNVTNIHQK